MVELACAADLTEPRDLADGGVYADIDATTCGVLAIGARGERAIYRMAIQRIAAREEGAPSGSERR